MPKLITIHELIKSRPELSCEDVYEISRPIKGKNITEIYGEGILSQRKKGYIHRCVSLNVFEKEPIKIPTDFRKRKIRQKDEAYKKEYICDLKKKLLRSNNKQYLKIKDDHKFERSYFTHDNGGRPFLVYVGTRKGKSSVSVSIYKISKKYFFLPSTTRDPQKWQYTQRVKKYDAQQVWIGENILGPPRAKGNSFLLKLRNSKFVHIGMEVFEFKTSDTIISYESNVGGNDVPYPAAVGIKNVYYLLDYKYGPRPAKNTEADMDMYGRFYTDDKVSKNVKPLVSFKMIHERI